MHVIDRTSLEPLVARSPRHIYAASSFASLGVGFGAAALGFSGVAALGSRFARANAALALACAGVALSVRSAARPMPTIGSQLAPQLEDRIEGGSLDYSIIIPVYNRPDEMRTLLRSLSEIAAASANLGSGEILVIDDGSSDDTAAVVRRLAPGMPIPTRIVSKRNGGVSSARNAGFSLARGDFGIVIDSDCEPEATWLESMLAAVRSDPKLVVFARIRGGKRPAYPLENLPDCKGFVGASYAMRRRSYLELGGCHERYGASHDDLDFVHTALARGYDVAHAVDGWISHPLRRETIRSMWRVGLNSKYGNLFAMRHGAYAARTMRPTPYYFFGIGANYGSSVAFVVASANLVLAAVFFAANPPQRPGLLRGGTQAALALCGAYIACLGSLGVLTGAPLKDLPRYVATLATFQAATLIGRMKGSREYGTFLL